MPSGKFGKHGQSTGSFTLFSLNHYLLFYGGGEHVQSKYVGFLEDSTTFRVRTWTLACAEPPPPDIVVKSMTAMGKGRTIY